MTRAIPMQASASFTDMFSHFTSDPTTLLQGPVPLPFHRSPFLHTLLSCDDASLVYAPRLDSTITVSLTGDLKMLVDVPNYGLAMRMRQRACCTTKLETLVGTTVRTISGTSVVKLQRMLQLGPLLMVQLMLQLTMLQLRCQLTMLQLRYQLTMLQPRYQLIPL